jgi:transposase-like protein
MADKRRTFSAEEKVLILRRHLVDKIPVSDLCDQYGLNPTVFYRWQKEFFENGTAAFERRADGRERKLEQKVAALTAKLSHKDEVIAEIMEAHVALKNTWGGLNASWVEPDVRDAVIDFVDTWSEKTELPTRRLVGWFGVSRSKFYDWRKRYGRVNEHNAWMPRDFWLEAWEKEAIIGYC